MIKLLNSSIKSSIKYSKIKSSINTPLFPMEK